MPAGICISKDGGLRSPLWNCCFLTELLSRVGFYHVWRLAGGQLWVLWGAVSTPQFSHPSFLALQDLTSASALSLVPQPVCPQVVPTLPPLLASRQPLTDTSCSHRLPLAISFPSLISKSASPTPPCLVSQLLSPFCTHCPISWLTLPVLGPQASTAFTPPSQLLCWISCCSPNCFFWSPPTLCISISCLPPTDTTHRWIGNKVLRCPDLQHMQTAGVFICFFFQNWANFGQIFTRMIKDASFDSVQRVHHVFDRVSALSAEHGSVINWKLA